MATEVLHNENIHGLSLKTQVQTKQEAEKTRFSERMLYETCVNHRLDQWDTTFDIHSAASGIGRMKSTRHRLPCATA
jgi:hypothetical protein